MALFNGLKIGKDYVAPKSSVYGICKASGVKRFAAWLLDFIVILIIGVGVCTLTSMALNYDEISNTQTQMMFDHNVLIEDEEGTFTIDDKSYKACTFSLKEENESDEDYIQRLKDNDEYTCYINTDNLNKDDAYIDLMTTSFQYILIIISVGLLVSTCIVKFLIPLFIGNGQTLGMKFLRIGLVTNQGIRVSPKNVFLRWSMGIYVVELMIPLLCMIMMYIAALSGQSLVIYFVLPFTILVVNIFLYVMSKNKIFIHDAIGGTVIIEMDQQMICNSLEEYEQRLLEEQKVKDANKKTY